MKESTPLQKLSQKENWVLFVLKGMRSACMSPIFKTVFYQKERHYLIQAIDKAITVIKVTQLDRAYLRRLK